MTEMSQLAIECNIITLLKLHPDPNNFIKELQNAAIDNAFHELKNR